MKEITICMLHESIIKEKTIEGKLSIIRDTLSANDNFSQKYKFIWDENSPQYVIITEHLYYGLFANVFKRKIREFLKNDPIVIFYAGECISPDYNLCDYAFTFDRLGVEGKSCHVPIILRYRKSIFDTENNINSIACARDEIKKKVGFCNFIYSNSKAHPMRDELFGAISKYKKVDSLGKHLTNANIDEELDEIKDWRYQSLCMKRKYKFSITSENAAFDGYVSEKILTSLQAHSIPIYWGSPSVGYDFNDKCFINVNDYSSFEALLDTIKMIDEDDDAWCKMISEPWFTQEQIEMHKREMENYYCFLDKIFSEDANVAKTKGEGFHPEKYRKSITACNIDIKTLLGDAYNFIISRF